MLQSRQIPIERIPHYCMSHGTHSLSAWFECWRGNITQRINGIMVMATDIYVPLSAIQLLVLLLLSLPFDVPAFPSPSSVFRFQSRNCQPSPTDVHRIQLPQVRQLALNAEEKNSESPDEQETLILLTPEELEQQMARLRNKYPTSEADYLAAARARSAAKVASVERSASDKDWQELAAKKKQEMGEVDDWESSRVEAGNTDSQILIPMPVNQGQDGEADDEPKLLLF